MRTGVATQNGDAELVMGVALLKPYIRDIAIPEAVTNT
jgi:hypothetical protein